MIEKVKNMLSLYVYTQNGWNGFKRSRHWQCSLWSMQVTHAIFLWFPNLPTMSLYCHHTVGIVHCSKEMTHEASGLNAVRSLRADAVDALPLQMGHGTRWGWGGGECMVSRQQVTVPGEPISSDSALMSQWLLWPLQSLREPGTVPTESANE